MRTIPAEKVELGALLNYTPQYKANDESPNEYQTIPINKMKAIGVYWKSFYQLDLHYFKRKLDTDLLHLLWNKYWKTGLSISPFF